MNSNIVWGVVGLAAGVVLGYYVATSGVIGGLSLPGDGGGQTCTQEAKICPDGSAVGRTGPNCAFAPCPGE